MFSLYPPQKGLKGSHIHALPKENPGSYEIFDTKEYQHRKLQFINSHVLNVFLQASTIYLTDNISRASLNRFLISEKENITDFGKKYNFDGESIFNDIPLSIETIINHKELSIAFEEKICFPECFTLYELPKLHIIQTHCTPNFFQPKPSSMIKLDVLARKDCVAQKGLDILQSFLI
ncbi:hypothetical protein O181_122092 [Austropuccinia psidii MF-1]|uniref:Uncharacterized protein n=1 Tax=Austropuccinia psidii MF-1 TaxID=1389203 RepID=A0A9Q3KME0_9BASI|nr:hypothetical protein [Austropuccinia psidii MF-1]